MNTRMMSALAAVCLAGCSATASPRASTELFIHPSPEPANEWTASRGRWKDGQPTVEFKHRSSGDVMTSTMFDALDAFSATEFRRAFDGETSKGCSSWISRTLDETPSRGYPRQIWYTQCDEEGRSGSFLHLYLSGRAAGYHVFYHWEKRPDAAAIEKWLKYMHDLYICDDDPARGAPCPGPTPGTAYKRVNGI
jgi:hypothetical protein